MSLRTRIQTRTRLLLVVPVVATTAVALSALSISTGPAGAAQSTVGLGTASSYSVLAGSTITNTGGSTLSGNLGLSPGTDVTGFPPGLVSGAAHVADAPALQAQTDLIAAYDDAAGRTPATSVPVELGGTTVLPGVYTGATLEITGTVTLDAKGDPDAVFVFKAGSTLVTASDSAVSLIGSANPCNVFWQVTSSATLGSGTDFVGTVLALSSITAGNQATIDGRLLARNGAVTLDDNRITIPPCGTTPTSTTSTSTSTTSTTAVGPTSTSTPTPTSTTSTTAVVPTPTSTSTTSTTAVVPTPTSTSTTSTTAVASVSTTTGPTPIFTPGPTTPARDTVPAPPGPSGGPGSPSSTTAPGQTTDQVQGTTTVPGGNAPPATAGPGLPRTGSDLGGAAAVGGAWLLGGAALLLIVRRRSTAAPSN